MRLALAGRQLSAQASIERTNQTLDVRPRFVYARSDFKKRKKEKMKTSEPVTKDPICGMSVDKSSALSAERDGQTFYFCSDHCRQKFMSAPAGAKPEKLEDEPS
jgi:YHS domain-containing protein